MTDVNKLDWQSVVSSNLEAVAYDYDGEVLYIRFKDGDVYSYSGVGEDYCDGLLSASSVGSYFHANIKGMYPTTKV